MNNTELINKLHSVEAWATGLIQVCQQTRRLLEAEAVSTTSNDDSRRVGIQAEARAYLRAKLQKQQKNNLNDH